MWVKSVFKTKAFSSSRTSNFPNNGLPTKSFIRKVRHIQNREIRTVSGSLGISWNKSVIKRESYSEDHTYGSLTVVKEMTPKTIKLKNRKKNFSQGVIASVQSTAAGSATTFTHATRLADGSHLDHRGQFSIIHS